MTSKLIAHRNTLSHESWLDLRRKGIGGSDAPTIMGCNPYSSPLALYLDKLGIQPPVEQNDDMRRGLWLEEPIAQEAFRYLNGTGLDELSMHDSEGTVQHTIRTWQLANIDKYIWGHELGPGILECKSAGVDESRTWERGALPLRYYVQLQHYMSVYEWNHGWLAVSIAGELPIVEHVLRDDEWIKEIVEAEAEFWTRVVEERPPEVDASPVTTEALKRSYPKAKPGFSVQLPESIVDLINERRTLVSNGKSVRLRKQIIDNKLALLLGEAEAGYIDDPERPVVRWSNVSRGDIDIERLKEEMPEIADKYKGNNSHRRFHYPK